MEQAAPYLVQLLKAGKVELCGQAVNETSRELSLLEGGNSNA
jgi:hypothetical protein